MKSKRRYGFTLIEVMVASALGLLAFTVIITGEVFSRQLIASARFNNEAEAYAMDQIIPLLNMNYDQLLNQPLVTNSVPTNFFIYPLGGTLRTGVLVYTNYCQVWARVDWSQQYVGGVKVSKYQLLWVNRGMTQRGPS